MAALNPRITVTVTPRVDAVLKRFSTLTGKSKSAMVGEILDESFPMFAKMVKVFEAAERAQKEMASNVVQPFAKAQEHLEGQLNLSMDSLNFAADDLLRDVENIGRRKGRRAAVVPRVATVPAARRPLPGPLSNRGGRTPTTTVDKSPKPLSRKAKAKK